MGITTLSVDEETAERFQRHRHDDHHNTDEVLTTMMDVLPAYDDLECTVCGHGPARDAPLNENHGIIEFFEIAEEHGGGFESLFYCSQSCKDEVREQQQLWNPDEPDAFIIGGVKEPRLRIEDPIWFERDGMETYLGIRLPGVLTGEAPHHGPYEYEGEPIYVEYRDRIIESGVIDAIHHEETSTYIGLGDDTGLAGFYHPDEEKRADRRENFALWYDAECPECGEVHRVYDGMDDELECGECEATFERPDPPEERVALFYDEDGEPRDVNG